MHLHTQLGTCDSMRARSAASPCRRPTARGERRLAAHGRPTVAACAALPSSLPRALDLLRADMAAITKTTLKLNTTEQAARRRLQLSLCRTVCACATKHKRRLHKDLTGQRGRPPRQNRGGKVSKGHRATMRIRWCPLITIPGLPRSESSSSRAQKCLESSHVVRVYSVCTSAVSR